MKYFLRRAMRRAFKDVVDGRRAHGRSSGPPLPPPLAIVVGDGRRLQSSQGLPRGLLHLNRDDARASALRVDDRARFDHAVWRRDVDRASHRLAQGSGDGRWRVCRPEVHGRGAE